MLKNAFKGRILSAPYFLNRPNFFSNHSLAFSFFTTDNLINSFRITLQNGHFSSLSVMILGISVLIYAENAFKGQILSAPYFLNRSNFFKSLFAISVFYDGQPRQFVSHHLAERTFLIAFCNDTWHFIFYLCEKTHFRGGYCPPLSF